MQRLMLYTYAREVLTYICFTNLSQRVQEPKKGFGAFSRGNSTELNIFPECKW